MMNSEHQKHFDNILDTFGGADGGYRFVQFKTFLDDLEERAKDGDEASATLLSIMVRFSSMINAVCNH